MIVKELAPRVSNYRATLGLDEYLSANGVIGLCGIDTRALTKKLRVEGAMRGVLTTEVADPVECVQLARKAPRMEGADLVTQVAPREPVEWHEGLQALGGA